MPTFTAEQALNSGLAPFSSEAGGIRAVRATITLPSTLVATDVVHMLKLPAEHVPVDLILECDDLDSGSPAITLDVGITADSVGSTEDPDAFLTASTVAQAGGMARMANVTGLRIAPVANERTIGITVAVSAGTGAAGEVAITLFYRAAQTGE